MMSDICEFNSIKVTLRWILQKKKSHSSRFETTKRVSIEIIETYFWNVNDFFYEHHVLDTTSGQRYIRQGRV